MKRFDIGKQYIFKTILLNNRLRAYEKYIKYAINNGYYVCSMQDFFYEKDLDKKHFILRHDVDDESIATRKMFEVEKKLGIHSTYYFRHSTIDEKLIQDMLAAGFEVGLHYETLSDYIINKNIQSLTSINISEVRDCLKKEISDFKKMYNPKMISVASHGSPINRKFGISNNVLLENQNYVDYDILFESYDKSLYENYINYHIMDGNIRINNGFSYKANPIDGIESNVKNILFLAHPTHWYLTIKERILNLAAFLLKKIQIDTNRKFVRIAGENLF